MLLGGREVDDLVIQLERERECLIGTRWHCWTGDSWMSARWLAVLDGREGAGLGYVTVPRENNVYFSTASKMLVITSFFYRNLWDKKKVN